MLSTPIRLVLFACFYAIAAPAVGDEFTTEQIAFFEAKIRPLLAAHCFECHSAKAKTIQGGLRLDSRNRAIQGGDSGPAIVAKNPKESLLIQAIRWESFEMPPKGKLADSQIALLAQWIRDGAPWPADSAAGSPAPKRGYDWKHWRTQHWAFRPLAKKAPPATKNDGWPKNDLDRFVLARLEERGMRPAEAAAPRVLARRLYVDLTGLPPSPGSIDLFVQAYAKTPDKAVRNLVDELLSSPAYGERWGRYWLDVARYSDGQGGFLDNAALPQAWRFRDWVVDAFNRDLPFDQFIRLQVAGDLIGDEQDAVATGFFALGPTYRSDGGDPDSVAQARAETLSDRLDTLGRGLLGLTLACARCHEHKFDPVPQQDYYSLAGVFNNTRVHEAPLADPKTVTAYDTRQKQIQEATKRIADFEKRLKKEKREPSAEESGIRDGWRRELERLKKDAAPKYPTAHALTDSGSADMPVAIRGNPRKPGETAPRRFLQVLAGDSPARFEKGSGRVELADALVTDSKALVARVFVNRVWMHHFGKAIVRTPSNFGAIGERPTHPNLLDWLAQSFVEDGWSIKDLHRRITTSAAYQMSSRHDDANFQLDGDNRWVWRMNPRRMDVEAWRDGLLSVTGELDATLGGPPNADISGKRRTLYFQVSRNGDRFATDELLRLFDFPLMRATIDKRPTSIVPQQYLFLLNSSFMHDRAGALVARLHKMEVDDPARIRAAYRLLFGRQPTDREQSLGIAFLEGKEEESPGSQQPATEGGDVLIADFEGDDYGAWKVEGEAFGPGPARGTLPRQMVVSGFVGGGLVNSYYGGDGPQGVLTSPEIQLDRPFVHFLVGGGKYPGETCIDLLVDGEVARTATGPNDRGGGSERLAWATWDVRDLQGRKVRLRITDKRSGGWGHINVDHIVMSQRPKPGSALESLVEKVSSEQNAKPSRWRQYAQVLLSSNEFMYLQ